jgi:hypothetical protein
VNMHSGFVWGGGVVAVQISASSILSLQISASKMLLLPASKSHPRSLHSRNSPTSVLRKMAA